MGDPAANPAGRHTLSFTVIPGPAVTDDDLARCATFFSDHYGIWGDGAGRPLKPKARVTMSSAKLARACFGQEYRANTVLIVARNLDGVHVGHAFVTKWGYDNEVIAWVTQLVVHTAHRRRYIATSMLAMLKGSPWFATVSAAGIASTHPAAVNTLTKIAHLSPAQLDLTFLRTHAPAALAHSPVAYLRDAKLCGALFESHPHSNSFVDGDGALALLDTNFFVDHAEPHAVLSAYAAAGKWTLGTLRQGHEFVCIVAVPPEER